MQKIRITEMKDAAVALPVSIEKGKTSKESNMGPERVGRGSSGPFRYEVRRLACALLLTQNLTCICQAIFIQDAVWFVTENRGSFTRVRKNIRPLKGRQNPMTSEIRSFAPF